MAPTFIDVPVRGGRLRVARWGEAAPTLLGIHGITASSLSLAPVARHLAEPEVLIAPDLRGRGASAGLPGPYGMRSHAEDCAAVVEAVAGGPVTVIGESMGGFVAAVLVARRPDLVERLVLVDGGLPPKIPEGIDTDRVLEAVLGPALARLSQTFASRAEYLEFWRRHPALASDWNEDVEAYLDYDLEPVDGGFRSRVSEAAVRHDGAEGLIDPSVVEGALAEVRCPVHLLRATRNLLDQLPPLIGDDVVQRWRDVLPVLTDEIVPDTNHYSLMLGGRGARIIAQRASTSGVTA